MPDHYSFAQLLLSEILFFLNITRFKTRWSGSFMPGFGDREDGSNSLRPALHSPEARPNVSTLAGDHHQLVTGAESKHTGTVGRARSLVTVVVHRALPS